MNKKEKKIRFDFWKFFWVIVSIIFIFISVYVFVEANGYVVDWKNKKIQKTALIIINSNPEDAKIYLSGKLHNRLSPARIAKIVPGWYDIKLEYTNYHTWEKTFHLDPGEAKAFDISLFLKQPEIVDKKIAENIFEIDKTDSDLTIFKNELYQTTTNEIKLLTRFSQNIKKVNWLNNDINLIYQIENSIYVSDITGSNQIKIYESNNDFQYRILSDSEIGLKDKDILSVLKIK